MWLCRVVHRALHLGRDGSVLRWRELLGGFPTRPLELGPNFKRAVANLGSDPDSAKWLQVRLISSSESGSDPNFAVHRSQNSPKPEISSTKANTACLFDTQVPKDVSWSAVHGDLSDPAACVALRDSVTKLMAQAHSAIVAVAHDLHPDFFSTHLALQTAAELQVPAIAVTRMLLLSWPNMG